MTVDRSAIWNFSLEKSNFRWCPTTPLLYHLPTCSLGSLEISLCLLASLSGEWKWKLQWATMSSPNTSISQENKQSNAIKDVCVWGGRLSCILLVGVYISKIIMDNSVGVPQRTKSNITAHSYPLIKMDARPRDSVLPLCLFLWLNSLKKKKQCRGGSVY